MPLLPVHGDNKRGLTRAKPKWLRSRGDAVGEVCVAMGAGYLRQAPEDLVHPGMRAIRPQLGTLEVQLLGVVGDPPPHEVSWLGFGSRPERLSDRDNRREMLGDEVSAQLLFEGRTETVASAHEHRSFEVTEPNSELRVVLLCEGSLAMDENLIGAATLPIQALLDAPNGELDVWLEALAPGKQASEQEMADANFQLRTWRRLNRNKGRGWRGHVRVRAKLARLQPLYRWYLRQVALPRGGAVLG